MNYYYSWHWNYSWMDVNCFMLFNSKWLKLCLTFLRFIFNTVHSIPCVSNPHCIALAPFKGFTLSCCVSVHGYCILMHITKAFSSHWNNMHQWIVHNKTGNMHQSILISCWGETVSNLRSYSLAFLNHVLLTQCMSLCEYTEFKEWEKEGERKKEREATN